MMNCPLSWEVLGASVDREFEHCPAAARHHIAECDHCQELREQLSRLGEIVRSSARYYRASPRLRGLISGAISRQPGIG